MEIEARAARRRFHAPAFVVRHIFATITTTQIAAAPALTRGRSLLSLVLRSTRILSPSIPRPPGSVVSRQTAFSCLAVSLVALTLVGCRGDRAPAATQPLAKPPPSSPLPARSAERASGSAAKASIGDPVIWEHLGSWSGRGSSQTESFTGQTGAFRIKWDARAGTQGKGPSGTPPRPATFKLTIHSSISGRPLQVAVDQQGPGADTAYVNEDPRVFFAVVDATNIEWSFSVEEAIGTRVIGKP